LIELGIVGLVPCILLKLECLKLSLLHLKGEFEPDI